jgi:hypothetical protein
MQHIFLQGVLTDEASAGYLHEAHGGRPPGASREPVHGQSAHVVAVHVVPEAQRVGAAGDGRQVHRAQRQRRPGRHPSGLQVQVLACSKAVTSNQNTDNCLLIDTSVDFCIGVI